MLWLLYLVKFKTKDIVGVQSKKPPHQIPCIYCLLTEGISFNFDSSSFSFLHLFKLELQYDPTVGLKKTTQCFFTVHYYKTSFACLVLILWLGYWNVLTIEHFGINIRSTANRFSHFLFHSALSCNENDGDPMDRDSQYSTSQKTKRMRTSFKHHQLRTMKSYFAINHNPDAKDLKQLAQKTGLTKRVLQVRNLLPVRPIVLAYCSTFLLWDVSFYINWNI